MSLNESVFLDSFFFGHPDYVVSKIGIPLSQLTWNEPLAVCFAHAKQICFCYWTEYAIQANGCEEIGSSKDAETAT